MVVGVTITVQIVGGPHDGNEIDAVGDRIRVAEVIDPSEWLEVGLLAEDQIGPSCKETVLPVHLTRNGYRAYWDERRR
jgi:hypothetical protein